MMRRTLLGGACAAAIGASSAQGQAPPPPLPSPPAPPAAQLDEVVVTAQRRSEPLQDVPVADTVIGSDTIAKERILSAGDLSRYTPGLVVVRVGGQDNFYVRGVGTGDFSTASDPDVPVFIDDVFAGRTGANRVGLLDIDRAEVLRGPQGTLVGRNAIAGAIDIVTAKPGSAEGSYVDASYGNYNAGRVMAAGDVPLPDGPWSLRLAGLADVHDGYRKNLFNGERLESSQDYGGRATLAYKPSAAFTAFLSIDYDQQHGTTPSNKSLLPGVDSGGVDDVVHADIDSRPLTRIRSFGAALHLTWSPGPVTVTSITAARRSDYDMTGDDEDGTPSPDLVVTDKQSSRLVSQEVRVASPEGRRLTWLVGGSALLESTQETTGLTVDGPLLSSILDPAGDGSGLPSLEPYTELAIGRGANESYAVFGDLTFKATDRLSLTAGVRYSYDHKRTSLLVPLSQLSQDLNVLLAEAGAPPIDNLVTPSTAGRVSEGVSFDDVTPRGVLSYKFTPTASAYFSITRGYKAGGVNNQTVDPNTRGLAPPFRAERVTSYELGFKYEGLERRVRVNSALYRYDYEDFQVETLNPAGFFQFDSLPAHASGLEVEALAVPVAGLKLGLQTSLSRAEVDGDLAGVARRGNQLANAPHFTLTASLEYDHALWEGYEGSLSADAGYRSRTWFSTLNADPDGQPGYTLANARLDIGPQGGRWTAGFWCRNLANKGYRLNGLSVGNLFGFPTSFVGEPRTFGVEVRSRF